jgi:hypothetical protein
MKNLFYKKMIIDGIDENAIITLFENYNYHELFKGIRRLYKTDDGYMMVTEPQPIIMLPYYKYRFNKINKEFHKNYSIYTYKGLHFE